MIQCLAALVIVGGTTLFFAPGIEVQTRMYLHIVTHPTELSVDNKRSADVAKLMRQWKGAAFVPGGADSYTDNTTARAIAVFAGASLPIDPSAWMDLQYAGLPALFPLDAMRRSHPLALIVPAGEAPFTMKSLYTYKELFDQSLRTYIERSYHRTVAGAYYDVWTSTPESNSN